MKGEIRSGPDSDQYDIIVSEQAAQKYHDVFFPGTPLTGYKSGDPCKVNDHLIATENMHFSDVYQGFALIEDKTAKKLYLCYDENYSHKNSTSPPRRYAPSGKNTVAGLVPGFTMVTDPVSGQIQWVVEGESHHNFRQPPESLPQDIKTLMIQYGKKAIPQTLSSGKWASQPHPYQKLSNARLKAEGLAFPSDEAVMYQDHPDMKVLASETAELAKAITAKQFPDMATTVAALLDEQRMAKNLSWESKGKENSTYLDALNQSANTSGNALRQYQIARRLVNNLVTAIQFPQTRDSLHEYLQLLQSMENVDTELDTSDYEAFYADPTGNPEEGIVSSKPKDSIPVIRDNCRGGLVSKPYGRNILLEVALGENPRATYLNPATNTPLRNYGDDQPRLVMVRDSADADSQWPMYYNHHTHSLHPINVFEYEGIKRKGICTADFSEYKEKASFLKSQVLVEKDRYCRKPSKISTRASNDLFGSNGLNVMAWPGMRFSSLQSDRDASQWSSTLKEETRLLQRYKELTPAQRNMAFELTMTFANAKRQPNTNPQKIKESLEAAIYLVDIATVAADGNYDNAADGLQHIRHLVHINMPRVLEYLPGRQSLVHSRESILHFIKAHKNPREGYRALQRKLKQDVNGTFLKTGELERETRQLLEQANTFVTSEMQYNSRTHPFYLETESTIPIEGQEALQKAIEIVKEAKVNEACLQSKGLADFAGHFKFQKLNPFEEKLTQVQQVHRHYLTDKKLQQLTGVTDGQPDLKELFKLQAPALQKQAEQMLLADSKQDYQLLKDLANKKLPEAELQKKASELSGAMVVAFHKGSGLGKHYDPVNVTAVAAAKAIAMRVLSTVITRPPSYTCSEGIDRLTDSEAFQNLPETVRLQALQYTTAALLQSDAKVNNLSDFSLWEMLESGQSAHPENLKKLAEREQVLRSKARAARELVESMKAFKQAHPALEDIEFDLKGEDKHQALTKLGEQPAVTDYIDYLNQEFPELNLSIYNLYDKVYSDYYEKPSFNRTEQGKISWRGCRLYPEADGGEPNGKPIDYGPITEEGRQLKVSMHYPPGYKTITVTDSLQKRIDRMGVEFDRTADKVKPDKPKGFPSNTLQTLFLNELDRLREKDIYLPLQDLQAAAIEITCQQQEKCIQFGNNTAELKQLVSVAIQRRVEERGGRHSRFETFKRQFENHFSEQAITQCLNNLVPVREKERCDQLLADIQSAKDPDQARKAELELQALRAGNGIKLAPEKLKEQIRQLKLYTLKAIEAGPDAIAKNYKELLDASNGSVDDQLKALAMVNVVFALKGDTPAFPKPQQLAAMLAAINSGSPSMAIAAEPGSGKSAYITPALIFTQQLGKKKNQNFPVFVTNNEILLQQDVDNFRPWGKAFNIPVFKLESNFENNLKKYSEPRALVFGTAETVMGDKLRLDTMDLAARFGKDKGQYRPPGQCPDDKVLALLNHGLNRAVIIDEYDTLKDRDCTGALIVSETSKKPGDNWGQATYEAYFEVFDKQQGKGSSQAFKQQVIQLLKAQAKASPLSKPQLDKEIANVESMTDQDWQQRQTSLLSFIKDQHKYKLQKTYTIGYEVADKTRPGRKNVVAVPSPSQDFIKELQAQGHDVRIYPINPTTSEIVRNASFSDDHSNYLAYRHGLAIKSPNVTTAAASAHQFFEQHFAGQGVYTLTATYGSGKMRDDLIPKGRTNINFPTPYSLDLTEYRAQIFENKLQVYDNAVNLAHHYIEQGQDVILLSSQQEDVFALDAALANYQVQRPSAKTKTNIVTLANLQQRPDHEVFADQVKDMDKPFGKKHPRKKGYIINATDACARGFNFNAGNAVLISIDCPPGERADLQKKRRVARNGHPGTVHSLMTREALPDLKHDEQSIPVHGGVGAQTVQLTQYLSEKDERIANKAAIRQKLHQVVSTCEQLFMAYYQQLRFLENCKSGRINTPDKVKEMLGGVINQLQGGESENALAYWQQWRDTFLREGIKSSETSESADKFIRKQLIEEESFNKCLDQLPHYELISTGDCAAEPLSTPLWLNLESPDDQADFHQRKLEVDVENCIHDRWHKAEAAFSGLLSRVKAYSLF